MHPHTGASTSAESSAWSVRNCPSFLAPSAQALAVQHPFTAPFQIGFGGVLRLGHPRKNMLHVPFPTSHILTFRHHSKGASQGTPKITAMLYSKEPSFNNSTSPQDAGRYSQGQTTSPK